MSVPPVTIVDAGVGNLGNVSRAFRSLGAATTITTDAATIAASRCLVLPGVGAFKPPRERVRGEIEAALHQALDAGAWLLGICVGYQLLFEHGEEYGRLDGLGLLPGVVEEIEGDVPLPHIGWNALIDLTSHPLLDGFEAGEHVYFVHSFVPHGVPEEWVLARAHHGERFAAIAARGRVLGTQFHPEKSGRVGLRLLANFLTLAATENEETPCN
ncbi:MAG: imidazole glycerol phosphate synthase subunit HisH [Acidobacteriota bacterium]